MSIKSNLEKLGVILPKPALAAANYVPFLVDDKTIYISGQLPMKDGKIAYQGKIGDNLSDKEGIEAAKLCAINILAQLQAAVKDLEKVDKCLKLEIFVNAIDNYQDHPKIGNGASNLIVEILGEAGKHSRFAMGAASLPFNVPVEIGATFKLK